MCKLMVHNIGFTLFLLLNFKVYYCDANKLDVLGAEFKKHVNIVKNSTEIDLIFLVDASSSVGEENFLSELRFVRKLLSDLTVSRDHTRIALITFGSRDSVITHINSISDRDELDKCLLLNEFLPNIKYSGGGTFTLGAFQTARQIFIGATRNSINRAVFLITDGFSNGGDPTPIAEELKTKFNTTIFTIGIKTGRSKELENIASSLKVCYLLHGFKEFESLARRALHTDLQDGEYVPVELGKCENSCDSSRADCTCGTGSGQYTCKCRRGYYGDGETCQSCPNGTWHRAKDGICVPCSDPNHESNKALSQEECKCKRGYKDNGHGKCEVVKCPELKPPENGYFVSGYCQSILNNACGVRCHVGYSLRGNSIRLCTENSTWSGIQPQCIIKTCARPPIPQYGQVTGCINQDLDTKYNGSDLPNDMPVDTECSFNCDKGHAMAGSVLRTCLPIAQWDGLRTTCKPIKCHRLGKVSFGAWEPEICGRERQPFGAKCSLTCKNGFTATNNIINCKSTPGRSPGKWNATSVKCIDKEPPVIKCSKDRIEIQVEPGSKYGILQLESPIVSDNSNMDITLWADPLLISDDDDENNDKISDWDLAAVNKFEIGTTIVTFHAVDASGNEASCNVAIEVIDKEPPAIENCESPAPFLTYNPANVTISWDEPLAFDNSQNSVTMLRSKDFGIFDVGTTAVTYTATDLYNNTATCTINITVIAEATCEIPPDEQAVCYPNPGGNGVTCALTCQEGYGFALTDKAVCFHDSPGIWDVPECTPMENPSNVWEVVNAETDCYNNETIRNLETITKEDGGEIIVSNCRETRRHRRNLNDDENKGLRQIEFHLKNTNKILQAAQRAGINATIGQPIITCKNGSVPAIHATNQKLRCVLCPKGTFFFKNRCAPCPVDTFSSKPGSLSCEPCPNGRSTFGKKRAKAKRVCRVTCPPGTNKTEQGTTCVGKQRKKLTCERPNVCKNGGNCINISTNKAKCVCSSGWTGTRCKIRIKQCYCQNGGTCVENDTKCLCPSGFVGNNCELETADLLPEPDTRPKMPVISPCQLVDNLCDNNGTCIDDNNGGYICKCINGFIGKRCNILPCDYNPCPSSTICSNLKEENTSRKSYKCECPKGKENPPDCKDSIDHCKLNPCLNNGQCISNLNTFECNCSGLYYGKLCEFKNDPEYILHFLKSSINDYSIIDGPSSSLKEVSMCVWLQTKDKGNYGTILSYANYHYDNAFTVTDYSGLVLYINGHYVVTDVRLNDGKWHHLCLTWNMHLGSYQIYVNGNLEAQGEGLSQDSPVSGNGKIVLGQEQDALGGKFSRSESYIGKLNNLNIWSKILTRQDIISIMEDCSYTNIGNIVQWADFRNGTKGQIKTEPNTFCSNCSYPDYVANGNVIIAPDGRIAIYSCHTGYQLYFEGNTLEDNSFERKCTAAAQWEGNQGPKCIPVSCPYPGYVPHSRVHGKFYNTRYNDQVIYYCHPGYEPTEPQIRTCLENGTWSGSKPLCRGGQCETFPKPANSNITIISEHDYDENFEGNLLFEIGTQLEFFCLENTKLQGDNIVSCQENGTWDHEIPSCELPGCSGLDMPPIPPNSYSLGEMSGVMFDVGTIIAFKCRNGHIQTGTNFTECLPNGKWLQLDLKCTPIECQSPPSFDNMIYKNGYNITKYYFGNMLKYECNEGYVFYGINSIRCLSTGKWTKMKGKCARISCNKPNVKPGELIIGNSYLYKDSLNVVCPKGSSNSEYIMKCTSTGKWLQVGGC